MIGSEDGIKIVELILNKNECFRKGVDGLLFLF